MRWIYVMIIPALFLLPTFGQAAGESSTPANICKLAPKATPVKVIKISFPKTVAYEKIKAKKTKATKKKTHHKDTANSNTSHNQTKPTSNTSSNQTNTKPSTSSNQAPSTSSSGSSNNGTSNTNTSTSDSNVLPIEKEVVRLVNIEREKQGLKPLELDSKLSSIARKKSQDMVDKNYFSHQSPTYGSPFDMLKQFGVSYRTAGENIAAGYPTAQAVVTGWMNSAGHRANILNPAYTKIGVGYVAGGSYGSYWTQLFTG
ncbi:CAP domain-containing protein [Shimazuella sp. AN120528]|uniref:CAP domain-containing protein n=1 Tax=Shimazuella soli TaxID=1892854 RepID=UPI001F0F3818|nr:CAP domain-containing protein [Shimazuella soli]MCH5584792.1 CAP domain-containing protein [Shimazuella soli]